MADPESEKEPPQETLPQETRPPPRTASYLSLLAIILSILALAAAFLVPGPRIPENVMAEHSRGGPFLIGLNCTHYAGAEVTLRVPGPGSIVVQATVGVGLGHTAGTADEVRIVLATTKMECTLNNQTAFVSIPASLASDSTYYATVPLLRAFPVSVAGSFTFYVNGVMAQGAGATDRFDSASLVAVFHPA